MLQHMQYNVDQCGPSKGKTYKLEEESGQQLIGKPPVYKVEIVWQVESVAMNGEDPSSAVVVLADGREVIL